MKQRTENFPVQEKQLRYLLDSVVSISSSLLANGWKRFFSTIGRAPQIFRFFRFQSKVNKIYFHVNTFQSILQRKSLTILMSSAEPGSLFEICQPTKM